MATPTPDLTHELTAPGVHVVRFIRPDLRPQIDPLANDDNVLYREVIAALQNLESGDRVIFNLGLIERFPTSFFHLMMKVREFVHGRQGKVILCCFRPELMPSVELMGGPKLFTIEGWEESAIRHALRK